MAAEQNENDKTQNLDKQAGNQSGSKEIDAQEDQLELDSDVEMEGLVDSITEKERTMKGEK